MSALSAGCLREPMPIAQTQRYADDEARWSAWMISAQSGDEASYRQLLTEVSDVVERYLVARFGRQEFVEDCVQEALLAMHQGRHTYNPRRPFRPWLFAIVRHKAVDCLRRGSRQQRWETPGETVPEVPVPGPDSDLSGGQLFEQLPDNLRQAVILTKIHGLSGSEAAGQLGISETALKVRVHRALTKLKKLLETQAV